MFETGCLLYFVAKPPINIRVAFSTGLQVGQDFVVVGVARSGAHQSTARPLSLVLRRCGHNHDMQVLPWSIRFVQPLQNMPQ